MSPRLKLLVAAIALAAAASSQSGEWQDVQTQPAEFHFLRVVYRDLPGMNRRFGRGWWRQDWPEAEMHFAQGIQRLTQIDVGEGLFLPLTDERLHDYPWIYATQVGYWDLTDQECAALREYLLRGGFLMTDDFYGEEQWAVFAESMRRVFPELPIVEVPEQDSTLHVLYDLDQRIQIPGLRHLRGGFWQQGEPHWRGIYDEEGRMMVAANYNMDIGDAWEHADWVEYPEPMTALAYRFGINYIVYAMTH
ncbi:MAG: DUF4159 domain-containing protein [Bryobacterales bacterium]